MLISIEGGEGVGKTTQARLLEKRIRALGRDVMLIREPGGTPLGEQVRDLVKGGVGQSYRSELLLFEAARAELVRDRHSPRAQTRDHRHLRPLFRLVAGIPGTRPRITAGGSSPAQRIRNRRTRAGRHHSAERPTGGGSCTRSRERPRQHRREDEVRGRAGGLPGTRV